MAGWLLFFVTGLIILFGYACYLCRGRQQLRLTEQRAREIQVLSEIEQQFTRSQERPPEP